MTALRVIAPGGASTIQDRGRPGYARYGVPEAGAMDRLALDMANRLAGNDPGEAAIEFAMLGGSYKAVDGPCRVAVAGGDFDVRLDGVPLDAWRAIDLPEGATLTIGRARSGVYGYLAVAGGFDIAPVLGSRSVHLRSGIGGGRLEAGALLPLRVESPPEGPMTALAREFWPTADGPIRIVLGPQDDFFTATGRAALLSGEYRVSLQSDRMGYRLEGPAIEHANGFNIVSDGIVLGSIQVPGTGQPIVLLADRQSTGGYPKIATVLSCDIRRLVQRGHEAPIHFVVVSLDEADAILAAEAQGLLDLASRIGPLTALDLFHSERLLQLNLIDGFIAG